MFKFTQEESIVANLWFVMFLITLFVLGKIPPYLTFFNLFLMPLHEIWMRKIVHALFFKDDQPQEGQIVELQMITEQNLREDTGASHI